jgi:MFS family permease
LLFGPLSESYGRRPLFIISFTIYTLFQIGSALAPNTGAVLVFRFLAGVCASCPLTNAGAILGDMFNANTRGKAVAIFVVGPFAGPALGPILSLPFLLRPRLFCSVLFA